MSRENTRVAGDGTLTVKAVFAAVCQDGRRADVDIADRINAVSGAIGVDASHADDKLLAAVDLNAILCAGVRQLRKACNSENFTGWIVCIDLRFVAKPGDRRMVQGQGMKERVIFCRAAVMQNIRHIVAGDLGHSDPDVEEFRIRHADLIVDSLDRDRQGFLAREGLQGVKHPLSRSIGNGKQLFVAAARRFNVPGQSDRSHDLGKSDFIAARKHVGQCAVGELNRVVREAVRHSLNGLAAGAGVECLCLSSVRNMINLRVEILVGSLGQRESDFHVLCVRRL